MFRHRAGQVVVAEEGLTSLQERLAQAPKVTPVGMGCNPEYKEAGAAEVQGRWVKRPQAAHLVMAALVYLAALQAHQWSEQVVAAVVVKVKIRQLQAVAGLGPEVELALTDQ